MAGCGETKTSSGKAVAVVNMETVAMMTGIDLEMNKAVQDRNKQLGDDLAKFQIQIDTDWQAMQKKIGDKPTDEQKKELEQVYQELNLKVRQAQAQARQNLGSFQQELANKFREKISPISLEIAKEHGYSIVILENPSLLAFDTSINITDLVVERLKQSQAGSPAGTPGTASAPGTELPGLSQPVVPLNPPQSTTLKLPDLDKESEKKEAPGKAKAVSEKEKPVKVEAKPESKTATKETPKAEAKPEVKPVTKKAVEEKPKAEKPAKTPEKK